MLSKLGERIDTKKSAKRYSISAFFPCYNDKGTIGSMVIGVKKVMQELTDDYEIIVIDDGSTDGSREFLKNLQQNHVPELKLIFHERNMGYGQVLRSGVAKATKDLIFYTDGDGQYDVNELVLLYDSLTNDIDIVNGFKIKRSDPWYRTAMSKTYHYVTKLGFGIKLKDVDCDFRLVRREQFQKIKLVNSSGAVCLEMVKKMQTAGLRFAEVPVHHYHRTYGSSQFLNFPRMFRIVRDLIKLWFLLILFKSDKRL